MLKRFSEKIANKMSSEGIIQSEDIEAYSYSIEITLAKTAVLIYSDMRFIAEIPRISLARLMCVRVTFAFLVFGGGRRCYYR